MKKLNLIAIFTFAIFSAGCKKDSGNNSLDEFSVDITFDGVLRKCPQFGGAASDEGTLLGTCVFYGDNLSIGCGSNNVYNTTASNGFNFSFNVNNVTHTGIYSFREENTSLDFPNATALIQRFTTGSSATATTISDNSKNLQKTTNAGGFCVSTNGIVGVQEIDITRYSSENGGIIEGTFYATVYDKPSGCFSYIPKVVTATFKVKRINL
ncbi:MAG: hypothetical protein IPP60_09170 [Sphingobacteriales bacterium]|nr:hypothetical protein [Sphingobacteriales bacterium]